MSSVLDDPTSEEPGAAEIFSITNIVIKKPRDLRG